MARLAFLSDVAALLSRYSSRPVVGPGARVAESVFSAVAAPFSGQPEPPANVPPPAYTTDQPIAPMGDPRFREGYHDHTFEATWAPINFGGITIDVARAYLEQHDSGSSFLGSYTLSIALTRFPAVFSALGVRIAPAVALPRQINGGQRGLSKRVAREVEDQLCPRGALLPSPHFPATLWGAIAVELAMMGFAVLQHVYGAPDAYGVRRIYTRRWPTWAVYYQAWRKTYVALTDEGPVDILNDGKFTLIGKTDVPHLQGALRPLILPALDGAQTMQARAQWINRFSDPKLIATMPEKIAPNTPEGAALLRVLQTLKGPGGFAVFPWGTDFKAVGLTAEASQCFKEALDSDNGYVYSVLTGVDTSADAGTYKPIVFWGIIRATVGDDIAAIVRGVNQGHVYPFTRFNYAASIDEEIANDNADPDMPRGWIDPVLEIPLPDPEADARYESNAKRQAQLYDAVNKERDAGGDVDQDRVNLLADKLGASPFTLATRRVGGEIKEFHIVNKIVAPDQVLADLGLPPLPEGAGSVDQLARERLAGKDKTGAKTAEAVAPPPDGGDVEPAAKPGEEQAA